MLVIIFVCEGNKERSQERKIKEERIHCPCLQPSFLATKDNQMPYQQDLLNKTQQILLVKQ